MFSQYTTYLASRLCGGSSRKLIAGWWYSILAVTAVLLILSCMIVGRSRPFHEVMVSVWSAGFLGALSVVGTMIMRKFHNSMAVGFFMGVTVCCSQWFAVLSLVYFSYAREQRNEAAENMYNNDRPKSGKEETLLAVVAAVQAILLGSFAAILAAHRSEILDKQGTANAAIDDDVDDSVASYDPPATTTTAESPTTERTKK